MAYLHRFVVEQLDCVAVSPESAPILPVLIIRTEIRNVIFLKMPVGSLLVTIVPLDRSIAVTSHEVIRTFGFPTDGSGWIATEPRSVADLQNFPLVNVVDLDFSVGTPDSCDFVIFVDFKSKHLRADISKKVDNSDVEEGSVLYLNLSRLELFLLLDCFFVHEDGLHLLEGYGPFETAFFLHLHYKSMIKTNSLIIDGSLS